MSQSKHVYNAGTEDEYTIIVHHGYSESFIIYDSREDKKEKKKIYKKGKDDI